MSGTGTLLEDGNPSGLGFPLLPHVVVTAGHVIENARAESLTYVPDGAPPVRVREIRFDRDIDVAVSPWPSPFHRSQGGPRPEGTRDGRLTHGG